jgi:hypothetical protein
MSETLRSKDELKMDQVIKMIREIADDIGAFPRNGLLQRIGYNLHADPYDLYDFLMCVVELNDYREKLEGPVPHNPDQLSLF